MAQKVILSLLFIILSFKSFSQELPLEVKSLLSDLARPPHTERQKEQLIEWEKRANQELSSVSKLDFFIISKAIIYKFYIQLAKDNAHIRFKGSPTDALQYLKSTDLNGASELTRWLYQTLRIELENFLNSTEFQNRQTKAISSASRNKMNYISTLTALLKQSGPEDFSGRLRPGLYQLAEQLFNYGQYFIRFTRAPDEQLKLGQVFNSSKPSVPRPSPGLDQLLAPVLKKTAESGEGIADSWQPKEGEANLPQAVDDWADDNDFTIRYVIPGYTPPEQLPTPVNDWEEVAEKEWEKVQPVNPAAQKDPSSSDPEDDWVLR